MGFSPRHIAGLCILFGVLFAGVGLQFALRGPSSSYPDVDPWTAAFLLLLAGALGIASGVLAWRSDRRSRSIFMYFWALNSALIGYVAYRKAPDPAWASVAGMYIWIIFGMNLLDDLPSSPRDL
jgi:hypothetical protein